MGRQVKADEVRARTGKRFRAARHRRLLSDHGHHERDCDDEHGNQYARDDRLTRSRYRPSELKPPDGGAIDAC